MHRHRRDRPRMRQVIAWPAACLLYACAGHRDMGSMGSSMTQGDVIAVDGRRVSVRLSSQYKVRPGDVLFIRRGRQYLGTLTVQQTGPDLVVAICDMESSDERPRCGDLVYREP